jgi:protein-tyrosine phosphatase
VPEALPPLPADRHVRLEGAVNFRDLGGYVGLDGRIIRRRVLFRADSLSHLSHADHAEIRRLGIATVIDLRSEAELAKGRFDSELTPVRFLHAPLLPSVDRPRDVEFDPFMLGTAYAAMIEDAAVHVAAAIEAIADPGSGPVVFHCTAGKDRTGVLAALLLSLLGVDEETIVEDYALTARAMVALRTRIEARDPQLAAQMAQGDNARFSAAPSNMVQLLAAIRERWGSAESYALAIGLSTGSIEALRAKLLEPTT